MSKTNNIKTKYLIDYALFLLGYNDLRNYYWLLLPVTHFSSCAANVLRQLMANPNSQKQTYNLFFYFSLYSLVYTLADSTSISNMPLLATWLHTKGKTLLEHSQFNLKTDNVISVL